MSDTEKKEIEKVVVCGAGPAGWTAAVYLSRANLEPIVYCGSTPGGQLTTTTDVENFPGFPEGIDGPKLMEDMQKQAERFGTRIVYDEILSVDFNKRPFVLKSHGGEIKTHSVIIATGANPKMLGLPTEQTFWNRGVHTCAVCDGSFYRGKKVAVVGGGDSAMEEANYLTNVCEKVYLIHRRDEFRASKIMAERVLKNPKIEIIWNSEVEEVLGDQSGKYPVTTGLKIKNNKENTTSEIEISAIFVAIGHTPSTAFLNGALETDDQGYLIVDRDLKTNVEGVWAAGDCHDNHYRQAITAAGYGCMAALQVERFLGQQDLV